MRGPDCASSFVPSNSWSRPLGPINVGWYNKMRIINKIIKSTMGKKMKECAIYLLRNRIVLNDLRRRTRKDVVNVHYWRGLVNLGDILSPIIVDHFASLQKCSQKNKSWRHLIAVGSVIGMSYQNATIWGVEYCLTAKNAKKDFAILS